MWFVRGGGGGGGGGFPHLWSMHPCLCWNICIPGGDKMIREMHYDVPFWIKWFGIVTTNNATTHNILSDFPYSLTKTIHGFTANKTKTRGSCSYGWQPQIKHFVTSNTSLQRSIKIIFFVVIKTDPSQQQPLKWQKILYKNRGNNEWLIINSLIIWFHWKTLLKYII